MMQFRFIWIIEFKIQWLCKLTLAAAAVWRPPIPGLLLIFLFLDFYLNLIFFSQNFDFQAFCCRRDGKVSALLPLKTNLRQNDKMRTSNNKSEWRSGSVVGP